MFFKLNFKMRTKSCILFEYAIICLFKVNGCKFKG